MVSSSSCIIKNKMETKFSKDFTSLNAKRESSDQHLMKSISPVVLSLFLLLTPFVSIASVDQGKI